MENNNFQTITVTIINKMLTNIAIVARPFTTAELIDIHKKNLERQNQDEIDKTGDDSPQHFFVKPAVQLSPSSSSASSSTTITIEKSDINISTGDATSSNCPTFSATFDQVFNCVPMEQGVSSFFSPLATQADIYNSFVSPAVKNFIDKQESSTVWIHGSEKSGRSSLLYGILTIRGSQQDQTEYELKQHQNKGIVTRAVDEILERMNLLANDVSKKESSMHDVEFQLEVRMFESQKDKVRDLHRKLARSRDFIAPTDDLDQVIRFKKLDWMKESGKTESLDETHRFIDRVASVARMGHFGRNSFVITEFRFSKIFRRRCVVAKATGKEEKGNSDDNDVNDNQNEIKDEVTILSSSTLKFIDPMHCNEEKAEEGSTGFQIDCLKKVQRPVQVFKQCCELSVRSEEVDDKTMSEQITESFITRYLSEVFLRRERIYILAVISPAIEDAENSVEILKFASIF